eukprot:jgi/Orpsp1_1/1188277/evm.model.d7180000063587.1
MKFLNLVALFFTAVAAQKCCDECAEQGKVKFYSIDTKYDMCGECCMNPNMFWIFKKFEKGLERAQVAHPCQELGYNVYVESETHGAMNLKMTLDKYSKPLN